MRGAGLAGVLAALTLAIALQISNGHWDARALALVVAAAVLAGVAAFSPGPDGAAGSPATSFVLGAGAAIGILFHVFASPAVYADARALTGFRWLAATAGILLSAYLCLHLRASLLRARFVLLLVCFVAMAVAVVRASPRPWIDVWVFQQDASKALLHGDNPYAVSYPNLYVHLGQAMYAPDVAQGGRVAGFPYPPLSLLAALPGYALLGDVRFAWVLALAGGAWLLARGIGGVSGELAALFILFQPRSFFVVEQSWTEPFLLCAVALLLYARQRRWPPEICGVALAAVVAAKQYGIVLALPLLFTLPRAGRIRAGAVGFALAVATIVPFWIWDGPALFGSIVRFHLKPPLRPDALSLLSAWSRFGQAPESAVALPVAAGLLALGGWGAWYAKRKKLPQTAEALAAGAFGWLSVVLFSKQGFCNYYWLCGALLAGAAAAKAEGSRETT